jgi:hypothetical protein
MKRLTLSKAFAGHYRPIVEHGGRPTWCSFEFAMSPLPECKTIEVSIAADADGKTVEWFPHIQRGMLRECAALRDEGSELSGIRVEIRKIHTHAIDTTAACCERYGRDFVLQLLRHHCVGQEP